MDLRKNPDRALVMAAVAELVVETLRETGGGPSGVVYAAVMGAVSLEEYETIVGALLLAGKIARKNHWLTPI